MLLALLHQTVVPTSVRLQLGLQQTLQVVKHRCLLPAGLMVVAHLLPLHRQLRNLLLPLLQLQAVVLVETLLTEGPLALAVQVVCLLVQASNPCLKNFTLETKDVGLGVHRVNIFLKLAYPRLQVLHLIFDFVDSAIEGLLLGFVVLLDLLELWLQAFLLL